MERSAKRQRTTKEAFSSESLISSFQEDEELAETFIPIIGKLYRNNVSSHCLELPNNASTTDILRIHQTQTDHRGRHVSVQETHMFLACSGWATSETCVGTLDSCCGGEKAVETTALDFDGAVAEEVAKSSRSVLGLKNQMNGQGTLDRADLVVLTTVTRELIRKPVWNKRDFVRRSTSKAGADLRNVRNCSCETLYTVNLTASVTDHENATIINGNYIQLITQSLLTVSTTPVTGSTTR